MPSQRSRALRQGPLTISERAARAADIIKRHEHGETFSAIGKHYQISSQKCHEIYWTNIKAQPAKAVDEHRVTMVRQFDEQETMIRELLTKKHYAISEGHLVYLREGEPPLEDDAFALQAFKSLRDVWAQKAKLLGLNAPDKVQQTVEVTTVTQQDLAIRELLQQQKALNKQSREDVHNGQ